MEQQLASLHWQPGDMENRIHELERECHEKNKTIQKLQEQLREQVTSYYNLRSKVKA